METINSTSVILQDDRLHVPLEIWFLIFDFLEDLELLTIGLVDHLWYNLLEEHLWKPRCEKIKLQGLLNLVKGIQPHISWKQHYFALQEYPIHWESDLANEISLLSFYKSNTIRSLKPIPKKCSNQNYSEGVFYFEMTIEKQQPFAYARCVGFGLVEAGFKRESFPGWPDDKLSVGYHGDDGVVRLTLPYKTMDHHHSDFKEGDVVGMCIDFPKRTIFFTKNGHNLGFVILESAPINPLYPAIGIINTTTKLNMNFGEEKFKYNLQNYFNNRKYLPTPEDIFVGKRDYVEPELDDSSWRQIEEQLMEQFRISQVSDLQPPSE